MAPLRCSTAFVPCLFLRNWPQPQVTERWSYRQMCSDAEPPASPPALVLRCLGAVGRKVFLACWHRGGGGEGWEQRRRRDLARPVPQTGRVWLPHGRPGELYCCNLGRTFLQPQNGSFSTLKQLFNLYPVILRPWECWVKAPFDGVF